MEKVIESILREGAELKKASISLIPDIKKAIGLMRNALKTGNKILVCGNGGSLSQAEHFAGELVGRFEKEGEAFPCMALSNPNILTAISNDYAFEKVYEREVSALGNKGDVLIVLTTSDFKEENGHSINLKYALEKAKEKKMKTIGLFSIKSDKIQHMVDVAIKVNSKNTARIQEIHIAILHIIAKLLEDELR